MEFRAGGKVSRGLVGTDTNRQRTCPDRIRASTRRSCRDRSEGQRSPRRQVRHGKRTVLGSNARLARVSARHRRAPRRLSGRGREQRPGADGQAFRSITEAQITSTGCLPEAGTNSLHLFPSARLLRATHAPGGRSRVLALCGQFPA
jgi:hypothetical protein